MTEIKLPQKFILLGETIKIELYNGGLIDGGDIGQAWMDLNLIKIARTNADGKNYPSDCLEATMWHEIIHIILGKMARSKLNHNEKFVNQLSHMVYQVTKTLK